MNDDEATLIQGHILKSDGYKGCKPIVWTIAGSDSGGGAGIQADLHTFQDLATFGCSVITAMTAQNSVAVQAIQCATPEFVQQQIQTLAEDLPAVAVKIGMLANKSIIQHIAAFLANYSGKVVLDPVMVASSGAVLLEPDAIDELKSYLFKYVDILTPNLIEAELLVGYPIHTLSMMRQAAQDLLALGAKSVLLKGGHLGTPPFGKGVCTPPLKKGADTQCRGDFWRGISERDDFCEGDCSEGEGNNTFVVDLWTDGHNEILLRGTRWQHDHEANTSEGFQVASRRGPREQRNVLFVLEQRNEDQQHPRSLKGDGCKGDGHNYHGSGCTLSAALTALLACEYAIPDALVLAKSYVSRAIRTAACYSQGQQGAAYPLNHGFSRGKARDIPVIVPQPDVVYDTVSFPQCGLLGFYPIVPDSTWVERLLMLGIQTVQLRIKDVPADVRASEIKRACALAKHYQAKLFINDAWQQAIEYGAYGVHLGQEDMLSADLVAIAQAGLRLGISTHNFEELARALFFAPSYIAFGPIYPTDTKVMKFAPRGLTFLKDIVRAVSCPVIAIGGIKLHHLAALHACNVGGFAVISAIVGQPNPEELARQYLDCWHSLR